MIRATTPTHTFTVPFDPAQMKELLLTYAQRGVVVLEKRKSKSELTFGEEGGAYTLSVTLSQQETARFRADAPVRIQLRALTAAGDALASNIATADVHDVLNDEVLA